MAWMPTLVRDLRLALRGAWRRRGVSTPIVLTQTREIGARIALGARRGVVLTARGAALAAALRAARVDPAVALRAE